jgi:hypothetical protein
MDADDLGGVMQLTSCRQLTALTVGAVQVEHPDPTADGQMIIKAVNEVRWGTAIAGGFDVMAAVYTVPSRHFKLIHWQRMLVVAGAADMKAMWHSRKKDYKLPAAAANTERRSRCFWSGIMCKSNYARASGPPNPRLTVT